MKIVLARVLAAAVLTFVAAMVLSTATVLAKDPDNPNGSHDGLVNNPGHHNGQHKHQAPTPVPTPDPSGTPASTQGAQPLAGDPPSSRPAWPFLTSQLTIKAPSGRLALGMIRGEELSPGAGRIGGLDWLILLVLPLLLAIWMLVFRRALVALLGRGRVPESAARLEPAST